MIEENRGHLDHAFQARAHHRDHLRGPEGAEKRNTADKRRAEIVEQAEDLQIGGPDRPPKTWW